MGHKYDVIEAVSISQLYELKYHILKHQAVRVSEKNVVIGRICMPEDLEGLCVRRSTAGLRCNSIVKFVVFYIVFEQPVCGLRSPIDGLQLLRPD